MRADKHHQIMIIFCSSSGDHRDRAAAGRPLMLGAAGDVDETGARRPADQPAYRSAGVTRRGDVGILQHGVAEAADEAIRRRLGLGEDVDQPILRL